MQKRKQIRKYFSDHKEKKCRSFNLGKKGMDASQIFIFTLSIIIVSMILIYGYNVIQKFIVDSETIDFLRLQRTMEDYVKTYSSEYGSVGFKKILAPRAVSKVCFLDISFQGNQIIDCLNPSSPINVNRILEDSFESKTRKNFFLFDQKGKFLKSYYIGNVTLTVPSNIPNPQRKKCNYLCVNSTKGSFNIKIVGNGDFVEITVP